MKMNKQKSQLRKAIPKLFKSAPCMEQSSRLEVFFNLLSGSIAFRQQTRK